MQTNEKINKNKPKVLVIGLDGGTWKVLKPLIDEGIMPNLKKLVDTGVSGDLLSTLPAHSGPAWTSFMTGKNPGKHGIFGFIKLGFSGKLKLTVNSSRDIKSDTIFHILSAVNKTVVSINIPVTYPPFAINGAMVSDCQLTPNKDCSFTYPPDLFQKFGFDKKDYILSVKRLGCYAPGMEIEFLKDMEKSTESRAKFSLSLMEKITWDLFTVVFTETDWLQHKMLHYIDRSHPLYNDSLKSAVNGYFSKLDGFVGDFIEKAGKDTHLFIISDHGFGQFRSHIYINTLLKKLHLLKLKKTGIKKLLIGLQDKLRGMLQQKSPLYRNFKNYIKNISRLNKRNENPQYLGKDERVHSQMNFISLVDWKKTKAYFVGDTGSTIFINQSKNNADDVYNKVIDALKGISDPKTQTLLNFKIYRKQDIYHGPYFDIAPDLVLDPNSGYKFSTDPDSGVLIDEPKQISNFHYREGILMMQGPNIKKGIVINNASIMDITPTILCLLGMTIPNDMDGKVLKKGIEESFLNKNPIIFKESAAKSEDNPINEIYSQEEMVKIKEHLADLGYID
ncbi:MAG: alkaline phosphatase family protein [Candidatus Omnitrophota bacterium]|nr:alkaline phosphatase family protein [Candidatus Omnitrophota bacterium]